MNIGRERNDLLKYEHLTEKQAEKMRYSMQTWYGFYRIPKYLFICDADTFEKKGAVDRDGDGVVDYLDYLAGTGEKIDENASFWLNTDDLPWGWLILNFDIRTYKDGEGHLTYFGGSKDMWQVQGAKKSVILGSRELEVRSEGKHPRFEAPLISGDVAVINPQETIWDSYYVGPWFRN